MIYGKSIEEAGQYAIDMIKEFISSDRIFIMSHLRDTFSIINAYPHDKGTSEFEQMNAIDSLCRIVIESKKAVNLSSLDKNKDATLTGLMGDKAIYSFVGVPIFSKRDIYGVICIISTTPVQYNYRVIKLLEGMALMLGYIVELKYETLKDGLTGLYQRSYIDHISQQWNLREKKPHLSLMYIDIDNFKQINDRYGHITGDAVLQCIAKRFKQVLGSEAVIIRMGGDEFVVMLEATESGAEKRAEDLAESLLDVIRKPIQSERGVVIASISIGICCGSLEQLTIDELIQEADLAMYGVKHNGKGAYKLTACK